MKTRWIKSVIETSKTASQALPFQRGARKVARRSQSTANANCA